MSREPANGAVLLAVNSSGRPDTVYLRSDDDAWTDGRNWFATGDFGPRHYGDVLDEANVAGLDLIEMTRPEATT